MNEGEICLLDANVTWKGRAFGSVLWVPRAHKKIYLNPSATAAVKSLDGRMTVAQIITAQSQNYRIPRERAAHDTLTLFDKLARSEIITTNPSEGSPIRPDEISPALDYVTLALSSRCNLRCKHCFVSAGDALKDELQIDDWLNLVKQLPVFKLFDVILTGGEPLLHPHLWTLIDALNAAQIAVSIFTNGLLVDEAFVERAKHALINSLQISLDGVTAETHELLRRAPGSFAHAARAIELLSSAGIPVHVAVTVTRINYAEHHRFFELCKKLGARSVNFSEIVLNGRARTFSHELALTPAQIACMRLYHACKRVTERGIQVGEGLRPPDYAWDPFHSQENGFKRKMCSAAKDSCDINSQGEVLACQALWWDEFIAGNIRQKPLKEIWEHSPTMSMFREMTVDQFRECNTCRFKYDCGGGCRSLAYSAYHDIYAPSDEVSCAWKKIFFQRFYDEVRPCTTVEALLDCEHNLESESRELEG